MVFVLDKKKMNERLPEPKTWLLSFSYSLAVIEKTLLTLIRRDLRQKKLIAIPSVLSLFLVSN